MNKLVTILIAFFQIGITFISMIILYMIYAISDYKSGIDGIIGIVIFQPIMAIVFSILTIFICGIIGLPIRFHKKLNKLWRTKFYISLILTLIGLFFCLTSFLPNFVENVELENNGIIEVVTIPNIYLAVSGWFLFAFGLLHSFPPYNLQMRFISWLTTKRTSFRKI